MELTLNYNKHCTFLLLCMLPNFDFGAVGCHFDGEIKAHGDGVGEGAGDGVSARAERADWGQ